MKNICTLVFVFICFLLKADNKLILPVCEVTARADIKESTYPGRVLPISQVNVVPQVSGEILEVCFANGARVKEGDILYRIDPVKYEAALRNAESKVAECKANVAYAELSYERHQKLLNTRAVSLDAVDNALSLRDSSRAAYAAAEAALVAAKEDLNRCTITAPISGKIGTTTMTRGNYAKAGGESLVSIVQMSPIRVSFAISNRMFLEQFGGISSKMESDATINLFLANGECYEGDPGKFDYVDNKADELTDTLQVYFQYANPATLLRPGGVVSVTLSSKDGTIMPAVPPSAILQDVQGSYVWVVDIDGRVAHRPIARGDLVGDYVFVEHGLHIGERIVADGAHKVKRDSIIEAAP